MEREPLDIERENEDARDDAIIGADDTGMVSGERLIFEGESARLDVARRGLTADEETAGSSDADAPTGEG